MRERSDEYAPALAHAETLIRQEKYKEAEDKLSSIEAQYPGDSQVEFLLGMIGVGKRDFRSAIRYFRSILAREPDALRVRLELARAYYLARDFDRSESEFRRAAAGHMPPQGLENIEHFLSAIAQERRWTSSFSFGIAPTTNANSGTQATTIGIYGLPFDLSADAQQKSGIGLNGSFSTEWSPPITRSLQLIAGLQGYGVGYTETARYNDYTVIAYAGPRYSSNRWSVGLSGSVFRRWYGNKRYNDGTGGRVSGGYIVKPWLIVRAGLGVQDVHYAEIIEQNGHVHSKEIGASVNINPRTRIQIDIRNTVQKAKLRAYSNELTEVATTVQRDFPQGYVVTAQGVRVDIGYDAILPAFGVARSDHHWSGKISIFNRSVRLFGFSPQISFTHIGHASNIDLYRYKKDEAELSFVRSF